MTAPPLPTRRPHDGRIASRIGSSLRRHCTTPPQHATWLGPSATLASRVVVTFIGVRVRGMIETTCQCGAAVLTPESAVGGVLACQHCGRPLRFVCAETLADGAGGGDFDAHLVIESGPSRVGEQVLLGGVLEITVGKLPERHIVLEAGAMVSRLHCALIRQDFGPSRWQIQDRNSTNGLFINGERVSSHDLQPNDLITIGQYDLRYVSVYDLAPATAPPPVLEHRPAARELSYGVRTAPTDRLLSESDPAWVVKLQNAAGFMIWPIVVGILSSCIRRDHSLKIFIDLCMALLSWFATWLLTSPEPGIREFSTWTVVRVALRICASIRVVGDIVIVLAVGSEGQPIHIIGLALSLAGVPQLFLFLLYLRYLALRVPNRALAANAIIVMVGLPASFAMLVIAGFYVALSSQVMGSAAMMAVAGLGGAVVFGIWYIILLIWFRHQFA